MSCYEDNGGISNPPPCELCPAGGGGGGSQSIDPPINCLFGDSEDKVCYEDLAQNPFYKCIYEALQNNGLFNSLMSSFTGNTMVDFEWKLVPQATSNGKNVDAATKLEWPGATSNLIVEITEDKVASFGPIYIALTLLHEAVHADIKRQLMLNNSGLLNASEIHSSNEIWDAYIVYNYGNNATSAEHEFMINRYIGKLGGALYDFASQNFPSEWVLSRSKYESFAYTGLTGTNTWNNEISESVKNTIQDDIQYVINHCFQECTN